jgi:hypothetical protein
MRRRWSELVRLELAMPLAVAMVLVSNGMPTLEARQSPPPQANVELDGELEVEFEDGPSSSRLLHFLRMGTQKIKLEFATDPPALQTGTKVRARGRLQNNTLMLSSQSDLQTQSLAVPNTFGEQRTIVILMNFQDNASQPYTTSHAYATTFQSTSDFYRENSSNQTWLTGAVHGWVTIAANSSPCDYNRWATLADEAAAAAGVVLSQFPRRVYAFPQTGACGWWGLGNVGGNPSRAWINGSYTLKVVGHEFGHNLGNYHSNSQPCDSAGCSTTEYGDDHDIMGNPTSGHLTAFQKERLGWLNYGASPPIQTVGAGGTYWVDAMSAPGGGTKALKILKSVDGSGRRTYFYVEARTDSGFDSGVTPGVLVHTGSEATPNSSLQFDLDRVSSSFDSILDAGQTLTDPASGVSITTTSFSASGASLNVSYTPAACAAAAPTVSLSGGASWAVPGASVNYTVSVRNNDGATCGAATFNLVPQAPGGWSALFNPGSLSLMPGSTASATLTLISTADASGSYSFQASASRPGPSGSVNGNAQIASALSVTLAFNSVGNGQQASVSVRANGNPVAGAAVTFTLTDPLGRPSNVNATTNGSGVASQNYKFKGNDPRGLYRVSVAVTASGLSGSANGSFNR